MFENVDGRTDGRTDDGRTDDGVTGILIAHLGAFGSGELKTEAEPRSRGQYWYPQASISLNKKKPQQQQNLGYGLCLGQS